MSILQALAARYDRLAAEGLAPVPGFAPAQIAFTIVLNPQGEVVAVQDERNGDGKQKRPRSVVAPQAPKRTVGIASGAFWDKTSYVLGSTAVDLTVSETKKARDAERLTKEHAAFRARHEKLLADSTDPGCRALLLFLRGWDPAHYNTLEHAAEMLDQNIAFRLDGERFIHDRPAARAAPTRQRGPKNPGSGLQR